MALHSTTALRPGSHLALGTWSGSVAAWQVAGSRRPQIGGGGVLRRRAPAPSASTWVYVVGFLRNSRAAYVARFLAHRHHTQSSAALYAYICLYLYL
eukprot:scaffold21484_cov123-Isochrysis_galbana.AAC.4